MQKVLVTGSEGYIGTILVKQLLNKGYQVTGLDTCFFSHGNLTHQNLPYYNLINKDIRDVTVDDLKGFDAVIHLAALSNDPLGKINEQLTYDINHKGTVNVARSAKQAGVKRFIFSSSCSLYGFGQGKLLDEQSESNPQTAYGKSKIMSENDIAQLADENFSPVYMRNATAYGISQRMRFDLVVNSLTAFAKTSGKIQILGDGTPWRPLVHIKDISDAMIAVLEADKSVIHNQAFNVGDNEENYQIKNIAYKVQSVYPECEITIAQKNAGDTRDYQVAFNKMNNDLKYKCQINLQKGVEEISTVYNQINLTDYVFESPLYTKLEQIKLLIEQGLLDKNLRWNNK
jgi:nucleoside-diphosphate-sugar epimerase